MSKIKVITVYEGDCCYSDLTLANMREYCHRWGYDFVAKTDAFKPLFEPYRSVWRRTEMLIEEMHDCEWLLCLDMDCFFLNMTISLDVLTDDKADLVVTGGFGDCPECGKPVHNVGVLCFRNCDWSRAVLHDWWNQETEAGKLLPEKQFTYCLGETLWISCHVCNNPEQASHVKVVPLELAGWATITGKPEQLLTHQYGAPNDVKRKQFQELQGYVIR